MYILLSIPRLKGGIEEGGGRVAGCGADLSAWLAFPGNG